MKPTKDIAHDLVARWGLISGGISKNEPFEVKLECLSKMISEALDAERSRSEGLVEALEYYADNEKNTYEGEGELYGWEDNGWVHDNGQTAIKAIEKYRGEGGC